MERAISKKIFRFLDLPAELRNKIYQYLLSTKYTKVELTYHEHTSGPRLPSHKPPHFYSFHTNILFANRQIYSEAADTLYRQNLFVSLTYSKPYINYGIENLVIVTRGHHAHNFKQHSLEVHLPPNLGSDGRLRFPYEPVIIAGEYLPHLCSIMLGICHKRVEFGNSKHWDQIKVSVEINVRSIAVTEKHKAGFSHDPPSVRSLLEPFRRLYSFRLRVGGHVTASYKEDIEESAAQIPPATATLICTVSKYRDEGNEAMQNGDLDTALTRYRSALDMLISARIRFAAMKIDDHTLKFLPEVNDLIALDVLHVRLRSILAGIYLEIGAYAKSYGCAQESQRFFWQMYLDALNLTRPDLGHTLLCKALAGKALGEPVQALIDIDEALSYCPGDKTMKEERRILCGLVRKEMHSNVQMGWADALKTRTAKSKKSKRHQRSAGAFNMARSKAMEKMIRTFEKIMRMEDE